VYLELKVPRYTFKVEFFNLRTLVFCDLMNELIVVTSIYRDGQNNLYTGSLLAKLQSSNKKPLYGLICPPRFAIEHMYWTSTRQYVYSLKIHTNSSILF
jgi:hypothetical protein